MKKPLFFLIACISLIIMGCAKIYYSSDAFTLAIIVRIIAIIPSQVFIQARRRDDPMATKAIEKSDAFIYQKAINSWLLKRKSQGKMRVDIQDIETTNSKLTDEGYFKGANLSPKDLCDILQVDGVIFSTFSLSKPMSEGAAVAVGCLFGIFGQTNRSQLIWKYMMQVMEKDMEL